MNRFSLHQALATCVILAMTTFHGARADEKTEITAEDFQCLTDMTAVRHFFIDNLDGDIEATFSVAQSPEGGTYPEGSVVQLVPGEAMVKRSPGFNPATSDWEFFELDVSAEGTAIRKRGFTEVVNRFGGNCFECHAKAAPQWDLLCDNNHGCDPIPLTRSVIATIQKTDPRCAPVALTDEDKQNLQLLKAFAEANAG